MRFQRLPVAVKCALKIRLNAKNDKAGIVNFNNQSCSIYSCKKMRTMMFMSIKNTIVNVSVIRKYCLNKILTRLH